MYVYLICKNKIRVAVSILIFSYRKRSVSGSFEFVNQLLFLFAKLVKLCVSFIELCHA